MTNKAPTSSSTMLHHAERLEVRASHGNSGAVSLRVQNDGWEVFDLTIFTGDDALAVELAAVINGTLAKHNRLVGQLAKQASV